MSIASKLEYLDGTKDYIRQCIQQKGVTVPAGTTFRQYGDKILEIKTEQHPDGWPGEGGGEGEGGTGKLTVGTATATGKDYVLSPPVDCDGFSSVNVTGDYNLKPENIAAGVTIYGVTGTMTPPTNMTKIPSEYEQLFAEARELYSGDYINLIILESDEAIAFGFLLSGFNVDSYNVDNTEFTASRWVYVAYNKTTKSWKKEDWSNGTSNGNSYVKNIRYSDRYLYYGTSLIYPIYVFGGINKKEAIFRMKIDDSSATYTNGLSFLINTNEGITIDWGDGLTESYSYNSSGSHRVSHEYTTKGIHIITITGDLTVLRSDTSPGSGYQSLFKYVSEFLTPLPPTIQTVSLSGSSNVILKTLPNSFLVNLPLLPDLSYAFSTYDGLVGIPSDLFSNNGYLSTVNGIFDNCDGFATVPEYLFAPCKNIVNVNNAFSRCDSLVEVPKLFKDNLNLVSVDNMFNQCKNLNYVADDLFEGCKNIKSMKNLFGMCTALGKISKDIFPVGLKNVDLTGVFSFCQSVGFIPEDIFDNIESPTNITEAFEYCQGVKGPVPEFWNESKYGTKFTSIPHASCFANCNGASNYSSIPGGWK